MSLQPKDIIDIGKVRITKRFQGLQDLGLVFLLYIYGKHTHSNIERLTQT